MRILILVVALWACKKKEVPPQADGTACTYSSECTSDICYSRRCQSGHVGEGCGDSIHCAKGLQCYTDHKCRPAGKAGDPCLFEAHCGTALTCYRQICTDKAGKKSVDEKLAADERKQFQDKLKQAGVDVPAVAERPAEKPAPSASLAIRTVTSKSKKVASAACDKLERLTGGGCQGDQVLSSYPSGQTEADTIGAMWNCSASAEVTAFALCARLP